NKANDLRKKCGVSLDENELKKLITILILMISKNQKVMKLFINQENLQSRKEPLTAIWLLMALF
ncbi:hypothetical protein DUY20_RS13640, partial [Enterococcus hirae]